MDIEQIVDGVESLLQSEPAGTKISVWPDGSITHHGAIAALTPHAEGDERPVLVTERGRHTRRRIAERLRELETAGGR